MSWICYSSPRCRQSSWVCFRRTTATVISVPFIPASPSLRLLLPDNACSLAEKITAPHCSVDFWGKKAKMGGDSTVRPLKPKYTHVRCALKVRRQDLFEMLSLQAFQDVLSLQTSSQSKETKNTEVVHFVRLWLPFTIYFVVDSPVVVMLLRCSKTTVVLLLRHAV